MSDNLIDIGENFARRDPNNRQTPFLKPAVTLGVARGGTVTVMRHAIDFDNQTRVVAVKIGDIIPRRMLPAEFETIRTFPKRAP